MAKQYEMPTEWENQNDYSDTTSFGQMAWVSRIGAVNSEVTVEEGGLKHVVMKSHNCARTNLFRRVAGEVNPQNRRVVWFEWDGWRPQITDNAVSDLMAWLQDGNGERRVRFPSLLLDFVNTNWQDDADVLEFYARYGPLWSDEVRKGDLRMERQIVDEDGYSETQVVAKGEWVHAVELQVEWARVLMDILAAVSPECKPTAEAAARLLSRLADSYGSQIATVGGPGPKELFVPEPASYLGFLPVGYTIDGSDNDGLDDILLGLWHIACESLNSALDKVGLALEKPSVGIRTEKTVELPLMVYKPRNLIQLIWLRLALLFTCRTEHPRYCPACDTRFYKPRTDAIWHNNRCRMRIERTLAHELGEERKLLSPSQKVDAYQRVIGDCPHKKT